MKKHFDVGQRIRLSRNIIACLKGYEYAASHYLNIENGDFIFLVSDFNYK